MALLCRGVVAATPSSQEVSAAPPPRVFPRDAYGIMVIGG